MKLFKISLSLIFVIAITFLNSCSEKIIDMEQLQDRNGVFYEVNVTKPFNGTAIEWHENGQKAAEVNFKNGKEHGSYFEWYENGQLSNEEYFKNGELISQIGWYANG